LQWCARHKHTCNGVRDRRMIAVVWAREASLQWCKREKHPCSDVSDTRMLPKVWAREEYLQWCGRKRQPSDSHYSDLPPRTMEVTVVFTLTTAASAFALSSPIVLSVRGARARVKYDVSCVNMCVAMCACAVSKGHYSMFSGRLSKPPWRNYKRLRMAREAFLQ